MSKNHPHRSPSIYIDLPKSSRNDPGIVPEWSQCLDRCYGAGYLCNSWLLTLRSTSKNQELRYTMIHRFDYLIRLDLAISCEILRPLGSPGSNTPGSYPHRDDRRSPRRPSEDATDVDVLSRSESESMRYWVTNLCAVPSLKYLKCHVRCWWINYNYMACIWLHMHIFYLLIRLLIPLRIHRVQNTAECHRVRGAISVSGGPLCKPAPTASTCFDMLRHASTCFDMLQHQGTRKSNLVLPANRSRGENCALFFVKCQLQNAATLQHCIFP